MYLNYNKSKKRKFTKIMMTAETINQYHIYNHAHLTYTHTHTHIKSTLYFFFRDDNNNNND
jgi:hypothetical protein